MTDGYPVCRLGTVASVQGGFAFKSGDFKEAGVPVLKIKNVRLREVDTTEPSYVAQSVAKETSRYYCKTGDLLISMTGSGPQAPNSVVGRVARFTGPSDRYLINQRVGRFLNKAPDKLDQRYLFYVLAQDETLWKLVSVATGSANQANISGSQIENLELPLPPLPAQKAIAAVLGALDDKIELNRRMNATLEAMARVLFQSWFVDFDPVRAKLDGRQPVGLDKATTALFPSTFQDSALGHIPKGWEVKTIEELAERVAMGPFGSDIKVSTFVPEGIPVVSGQHLRGTLLDDSEFNFVSVDHADRLKRSNVQRGDVIFTHAGSIGQVAYIPEASRYERYIVSQRQSYMRCNCALVSPFYITSYFKTSEGQHRLLANTSSTGVPSISQPVTYLRQLKMVVPPPALLEVFDATVGAIHLKMADSDHQSRTLATLRDTLLPKLLSGELRVATT